MSSVQYLNFGTRAFFKAFKGPITHIQRSTHITSAWFDELKKQHFQRPRGALGALSQSDHSSDFVF